ncbi:MAG: peptidoglycan-N-acetylglucosamine deacetylase [Frankiaceae bacterium]|nr:peptidoglycan-N-acetylglucosamine deacetylase [Frankiaceae bacterium]
MDEQHDSPGSAIAPAGAAVGHSTKRPSPELSRRALITGAGLSIASAGVFAGAGETRYGDVASARARADAAGVSEGSRSTSVRVLWRAETDRKVMALTFDDGPGDALTAGLLDVLRDKDVRASFCVVGTNVQQHRDLIARQVTGRHELLNHSWDHADLSLLDYSGVSAQLERTDTLLAELTGARPAMIRPPFGRINGQVLQHAAESRRSVLMWSIRFHEADRDSAANVDDVMAGLRPGLIVLGHDFGPANRAVGIGAVPGIIDAARAKGYEFVTASEMLALDATP